MYRSENEKGKPYRKHEDSTEIAGIEKTSDREYGRQHKSGPTADNESDISYLTAVETALLREMHLLQNSLEVSRKQNFQSHHRRPFRRTPGNTSTYNAASDTGGSPTLGALRGEYRRDFRGSVDSTSPVPTLEKPAKQRIISVSLRLPTREDRESVRQQLFDSGVPPKGMFCLDSSTDIPFVWVGIADGQSDFGSSSFVEVYGHTRRWRSTGIREPLSSRKGKSLYIPVPIEGDSDLLKNFHSFADSTLYSMLHYDYSNVINDHDSDEYFAAYKIVNQHFAQAISEIYEDGDIIWVHNYQLMLLPSMLREGLWYSKIGYFLYTPFPSAEIFRILPHRTEILKGVLGADLIGFFTYDYSKQFVSSCTQLLGLEGIPNSIDADPRAGRKCEIGIYPAGIDVKTLMNHVSSKSVKARVAELREQFANRKVIVGVDRLDDCFAGIPLKLLAFEKLLTNHPEWIDQVVLVQVAMLPKQSRSPASSRAQKMQINEFVGRINAFFGTLTFSPVQYITAELDPSDLHALMCVGHVCVVSKVRDGMGLVPYEWTVCQRDSHRGPIVLSEFSGCARSFSRALHVNPWDVDDVAVKMKEGLEMKEEARSAQNRAAYSFVTSHTSAMWGFNFLEDLESVSGAQHGAGYLATPQLDIGTVIKAYRASSSGLHSPIPSSAALSTLGSFGGSPLPNQIIGSVGLSDPLPMFSSRGNSVGSNLSAGGGFWPSLGAETFGRSREKSLPSSDTGQHSSTASGHSSSGSLVGSATPSTPSFCRKQGYKKKLFILDYEGTLVPFQSLPELCVPHTAVLDVISSILNACPDNVVLILSGRDRKLLSKWFGHLDVFLSAEDGSFLRRPGDTAWIPLFRKKANYDLGPTSEVSGNVCYKETCILTGSSAQAATKYSKSFADGVAPLNLSLNGLNKPKLSVDLLNGETSVKSVMEATKSASSKKCVVDEENPSFGSNFKSNISSLGSFGGFECANGGPFVAPWKDTVMKVMTHFAERTPGVYLEKGDVSLTWHYSDADKTFGQWQARDLHKHLESFLLQHFKIEVVAEEGKNRWVKVHPVGANKTDAIAKTIELIHEFGGRSTIDDMDVDTSPKVDFIFCIGDDRADERMFEMLRDERNRRDLGIKAIGSRIFTCRVGSSVTVAQTYLDSPQRVLEVLDEIISRGQVDLPVSQ